MTSSKAGWLSWLRLSQVLPAQELLSGCVLHNRNFQDSTSKQRKDGALAASYFKDEVGDGEGIQQIFMCPKILNLLSKIKTPSCPQTPPPQCNKLHIKIIRKAVNPNLYNSFHLKEGVILGEVQEYVYLSNYSIKDENLPNMS